MPLYESFPHILQVKALNKALRGAEGERGVVRPSAWSLHMSPVAAHSFDRVRPKGISANEFDGNAQSVSRRKTDQPTGYPVEVHICLSVKIRLRRTVAP